MNTFDKHLSIYHLRRPPLPKAETKENNIVEDYMLNLTQPSPNHLSSTAENCSLVYQQVPFTVGTWPMNEAV